MGAAVAQGIGREAAQGRRDLAGETTLLVSPPASPDLLVSGQLHLTIHLME